MHDETSDTLPFVIELLVPHLRNAASPDDRRLAYDAVVAPVRGPLRPGLFAIHRDALTAEVLDAAFVRDLSTPFPDPETGLPPPARPPTEPVLSAAVADLIAFATDSNRAVRSLPFRLVSVASPPWRSTIAR